MCAMILCACPDTYAFFDFLKRFFDWPSFQRSSDAVRLSLCYELPRDRWITFHVPVTARVVKVVTNADLTRLTTKDPEAKWRYAIAHEIRNRTADRTIQSGVYHHITKLTRFRGPAPGEVHLAAYYRNRRVTPGDGRLFIINLDGYAEPGELVTLRFRLASMDPGVTGAVLRAYALEPTSGQRLDHLWKRLSTRTREKLAEGNVYGQEFLTAEEKRNVVRALWKPLAPQGIEGRDYQLRRLYVREDIEGTPIEEPVTEAGMVMDSGLRATVPVPRLGRRLRLEVVAAEPTRNVRRSTVSLKWFGLRPGQEKAWLLPWTGRRMSHVDFYSGGLLEVSVDQPAVLNVFALEGNEEVRVTPEEILLRTYEIGASGDLTYRIAHSQGRTTPFRVDIRPLRSPSHGASRTVRYTFLDQAGSKLSSGTLHVQSLPTRYDRPLREREPFSLCEPRTFYFSIRPQVRFLRFSCDQPSLISAYTRPSGRSKLIRVPEDYSEAGYWDEEREPFWFSLRPLAYEDLLKDLRSFVLEVRLRPPEVNPYLVAGTYLWENFRPQGQWLGEYILALPDEDRPYTRDEALVSTFKGLPSAGTAKVSITSGRGLRIVRPSLLFFSDNRHEPFSISLLVDGQPYFSRSVVGRKGLLRMPPLAEGDHWITVTNPVGKQLLMNYVASEETGRLLRFANQVSDEPLSVRYEKRSPGEENVSMVFFALMEPGKASTVRIRLTGTPPPTAGPGRSFSIMDRTYVITPPQEGPCPVLNKADETCTGGRRLFFPLGEDMPPGHYEFEVTLEDGPRGYLTMARLVPGLVETRAIHREAHMTEPSAMWEH